MAEVAPQDWLECLQPSRKKELALWKVSKQKGKKKKVISSAAKGRIAFWCSLYSASFKEQDVNRTDATSDMTCISN